jgi:hypothetical protein
MIFTACLFFYGVGPKQPNRENEVSSLPPVNRAQELTGHAKFEDVIPEGGNNRSEKLIHPSSSPIKWDEEAA